MYLIYLGLLGRRSTSLFVYLHVWQTACDYLLSPAGLWVVPLLQGHLQGNIWKGKGVLACRYIMSLLVLFFAGPCTSSQWRGKASHLPPPHRHCDGSPLRSSPRQRALGQELHRGGRGGCGYARAGRIELPDHPYTHCNIHSAVAAVKRRSAWGRRGSVPGTG